jgi:hypothetical protein
LNAGRNLGAGAATATCLGWTSFLLNLGHQNKKNQQTNQPAWFISLQTEQVLDIQASFASFMNTTKQAGTSASDNLAAIALVDKENLRLCLDVTLIRQIRLDRSTKQSPAFRVASRFETIENANTVRLLNPTLSIGLVV